MEWTAFKGAADKDIRLPQSNFGAVLLYDKACRADDLEACCKLGTLLHDDPESHASLAQRQLWSDIATDGYKKGSYGRMNAVVTHWTKACKSGHSHICGALAELLFEGADDLPKDSGRSATAAITGCRAGYGSACFTVGALIRLGVQEATQEATIVEAFGLGCRYGDAPSCTEYGTIYDEGGQRDLNLDFAREQYRAGCTLGDPAGCRMLAIHYRDGRGVEKDPQQVLSLLKQACDQGWALACFDLGVVYTVGNLVPIDGSKAIAPLIAACEANLAEACYNLSLIFQGGPGVTVDAERATKYLREACAKGIQSACR